MTTLGYEVGAFADSGEPRADRREYLQTIVNKTAGRVAVEDRPMNEEHQHYEDWLEQVESQSYLGC